MDITQVALMKILKVFFIVALVAAAIVVLAATVAFAGHEVADQGFQCPHCSWWNGLCKLGNWIDGCEQWIHDFNAALRAL